MLGSALARNRVSGRGFTPWLALMALLAASVINGAHIPTDGARGKALSRRLGALAAA